MDILENKRINPHWIRRLLGERKALLSISSDGLVLERVCGKCYVLSNENLTRENILHQGRLFSRIDLPTDRGKQHLRGLGKAEVGSFFDWLQDYRYWLQEYQKLAPSLRQDAEEINKLLHAGYLRHSRWMKARARALRILN